MQKLNCITCKTELGTITSKVVAPTIKNLQKIDVDTSNGNLNLKCGTCNNWNSFIDGVQSINEKRKSKEVLEYKPFTIERIMNDAIKDFQRKL